MRIMTDDEVRAELRFTGGKFQPTHAELETAERAKRELLLELGKPNADLHNPDPTMPQGDPDLAYMRVGVHRHDGQVWLIWATDGKFSAIPCTAESIAYVLGDTFPPKVARAASVLRGRKNNVWVSLGREEQAMMRLIARTPSDMRATVTGVCEAFAAILRDTPIDCVMPAEVEPLIDESREPDPDVLRARREEKKELLQLEQLRAARLAKQKEWAEDAERQAQRQRAYLMGSDRPAPKVRDVSGNRK